MVALLTSVLADAGWLLVLGVEAVPVLVAVWLPGAAGVTVLATVLATVDVAAPTTDGGEALAGAELTVTSEDVSVVEATAGSALDDGAEPAGCEEVGAESAAKAVVDGVLLAACVTAGTVEVTVLTTVEVAAVTASDGAVGLGAELDSEVAEGVAPDV